MGLYKKLRQILRLSHILPAEKSPGYRNEVPNGTFYFTPE